MSQADNKELHEWKGRKLNMGHTVREQKCQQKKCFEEIIWRHFRLWCYYVSCDQMYFILDQF